MAILQALPNGGSTALWTSQPPGSPVPYSPVKLPPASLLFKYLCYHSLTCRKQTLTALPHPPQLSFPSPCPPGALNEHVPDFGAGAGAAPDFPLGPRLPSSLTSFLEKPITSLPLRSHQMPLRPRPPALPRADGPPMLGVPKALYTDLIPHGAQARHFAGFSPSSLANRGQAQFILVPAHGGHPRCWVSE